MKNLDDDPSVVVSKSGTQYRIRAAVSDDSDEVARLAGEVFGEVVGEKVGAAIHDVGKATGILGAPRERSIHAKYWLAIDSSDRPVGMIGLYSPRWIGRQVLYLGWYAVLPELQGQGIGRALFKYARSVGEKMGARSIMVETSLDPIKTVRFYESEGFEEIAQIPDYWEDGSTLLLMRHAL